MARSVDYKTHILIGVHDTGGMTVIADWPHVPKQTEVQKEIDTSGNGYVTYVLCTPTSVIPAAHDDQRRETGYWSQGRRS